VPAASKGLCGAAAACIRQWRRGGGGVNDDCVYSHPLQPDHRSSPCTTPSCVDPATTCRRSVAMDTRNDVTDNTPHQSRPAPPPVTIATQDDGSGGCGVASGWWEPCVKTAHGIMFPKKNKINCIFIIRFNSSSVRPAPHSAPHTSARQPSYRHHCSSFSRRQRAKPPPRVTSILWWWSEGE